MKITTFAHELEIDVQKVPSIKPLAFAMGFYHSLTNQPFDVSIESETYCHGYIQGKSVKEGKAKMPTWLLFT